MADKDLLADAKEAFKLAAESEAEQRRRSLEDIRFARLGEQWPAEVKRQREIEMRPCLTHNMMPAFAKQVINDSRQNRPAIKFHPIGDGADRETAEILNGLVRNIEYTSNADIAYDTGIENTVYGGLGYFVVRTEYASDDTFDLDLQIEPVFNPFSVYGDPHSVAADSSDWNDAFITDLVTKEQYQKRWPKADMTSFDTASRAPADLLWVQDERLQIAEWWRREAVPGKLVRLSDGTVLDEQAYMNLKPVLDAQEPPVTVVGDRATKTHKVTQHIVSGGEVLETNPWRGRYIPIIPVYGETVNIEGKRYFQSLIHFAKDSQRQYNYWSTTSTELLALQPKAPYVGAAGQFENDPNWKTANNVSHPYLEYDPVEGAGAPERQVFAGPPAGAIQEIERAASDMRSIMGIQQAGLGQQGNEVSGRAILARQRESDVSTFNFIDNVSRAIRHLGRVLADLIPEHYDAARVIRCIKEDGSNFSVPINQPVMQQPQQPQQQPPMPNPMGAPMGPPPQIGPAGAMAQPPQQAPQPPGAPPQWVPAPQGYQNDPMLSAIVKTFDITAGKYDVTVESGPSFTTRREEAASQMLEFIRVLPQSAPLIGDLLAKNLDWPGADEMAKRLQAMLPPQIQGQNPQVAQMQQQLQQQDAHAKDAVAQLQQKITQLELQVKDKSQDAAIEKYNAETKRIAALATAVKDGVQLTQTAEGGVQATPLVQGQPSPDTQVDAAIKMREMQIKETDQALRDRELRMQEAESSAKVKKSDAEAAAIHIAQVQVPTDQHNAMMAHHSAMINALHTAASNLVPKTVRKRAKATKQPDGSYALESVEEPITDQTQGTP
jgi:hypothetical protein